MRFVLHAKIYNAKVTEADPTYIGSSIVVDKDLIDRADFWHGEKVHVLSNTTGVKLETQIVDGKRGSGMILLNGACARAIKKGEIIMIEGFKLSEKQIDPIRILVDENNKFAKVL